MSDKIYPMFGVTIEIDPDVWQSNYGTDTDKIHADVETALFDVIQHGVNEWIARTGNVGRVTDIRANGLLQADGSRVVRSLELPRIDSNLQPFGARIEGR